MHNIQATISVIIVNWNAGSLLRDCISSIGLAKHDGFALSEVVVVDNASTDDSLNGIDQLRYRSQLSATEKTADLRQPAFRPPQ